MVVNDQTHFCGLDPKSISNLNFETFGLILKLTKISQFKLNMDHFFSSNIVLKFDHIGRIYVVL